MRVNGATIASQKVQLPASKYLANRYIALAAVAASVKMTTQLNGLPENDDIDAALQAVQELGVTCRKINGVTEFSYHSPTADSVELSVSQSRIHCRDSGTLSRFITAVAATQPYNVVIDASEQMRQRPMQEMIEPLRQLGVDVNSKQGFLPIEVTGPIKGGVCELDASRSSQFLSGLLIAALSAEQDTEIWVKDSMVSSTYVDLTIAAIERFGATVTTEFIGKEQFNALDKSITLDDAMDYWRFRIAANQPMQASTITVESDVVSSSYFMAAALLAKSDLTLSDYHFSSPQGEAQFPEVLRKMGAKVEAIDGKDLRVAYQGRLQSIECDMGNMPDAVPTLAVIAAFADGTTRITNIAHLAYKESNRIDDLCEQLIHLGVDCRYGKDFIEIKGRGLSESVTEASTIAPTVLAPTVSSCHDHRLAMSLALFSIQGGALNIEGGEAVNKSFPTYWQVMQKIGMKCDWV